MHLKLFSFLTVFLFGFLQVVSGQDTIILLRGDTILATGIKEKGADFLFKPETGGDTTYSVKRSLVRKIIYADGTVRNVPHVKTFIHENLTDTLSILVKGNTYFHRGVRVDHRHLGRIYHPMNDNMLDTLYMKGINAKHGSIVLKFMPIPLGVVGYSLVMASAIRTDNILSPDPEYGNAHLFTPGVVLLGAALATGITSIFLHKYYKKTLRKSADRYNMLISKYR